MLLSSSFCDQFAYIKVLVPGVTYLITDPNTDQGLARVHRSKYLDKYGYMYIVQFMSYIGSGERF